MRLKNFVLIAFFVSGMAALVYEIVWFRPLQLVFGSSVYALSTMLTSFMAGFALGSYLFSRFADRIKKPLMVFVIIELCIAIYGILIIFLFNALPSIYFSVQGSLHGNFTLFALVQFLLMFSVMLIPTVLMGGTWPIANKIFVDNFDKLGKGTGELYSANSLGAIFGSFGAGFILIPLLGIRNSSLFAALLNFIAAIILYSLIREKPAGELMSER